MRKIREIIESSTPPIGTDIAWLHNNTLKFFINGEWKSVCQDNNLSIKDTKEEVFEESPYIKEVIIDENEIDAKLDSSLEEKLKACARVIILRKHLNTHETYPVIYNRMDTDVVQFVNISINDIGEVAAFILYLDTKKHILIFE